MPVSVETEEKYRDSLIRLKLPEYMHDGVIRYIVHRIPPGDFLTAVMSNDLKEAVVRADSENMHSLYLWVRWFYNYAPAPCWGSPAKVQHWLTEKAELRKERMGENS